MRGIILAAFAAAAAIAVFAILRLSGPSADNLVDPEALPGDWRLVSTELCNPPLPERLIIGSDLRYVTEDRAGAIHLDQHARFELQSVGTAYPDRVFRANAGRLELLNRLGCKAVYARGE